MILLLELVLLKPQILVMNLDSQHSLPGYAKTALLGKERHFRCLLALPFVYLLYQPCSLYQPCIGRLTDLNFEHCMRFQTTTCLSNALWVQQALRTLTISLSMPTLLLSVAQEPRD